MTEDRGHSTLDRESVIEALRDALSRSPFIHAFWEGGAAATGMLDEWSDLDLYLLVDDDKVDESFGLVEETMSRLSEITLKLPIPQTGWEGVSQAFYKLARMSEYQIIDLAVVTMSSDEKFLEPTVHGEARFMFNKVGDIRYPPYDAAAVREKMAAKRDKMAARMEMFGAFFDKEMSRGHLVEASDLYYRLTLPTLVTLLRMKYRPEHHDFGTRHVHEELPRPVVERLTRLCLFGDPGELAERQREAKGWIEELLGSFQ